MNYNILGRNKNIESSFSGFRCSNMQNDKKKFKVARLPILIKLMLTHLIKPFNCYFNLF